MSNPFSTPKWNAKERASFARRLSFLLRSGMPLPAALDSLIEEESDKRARAALAGIRDDVERGVPLSEAAAAHPKLFSPFTRQVISVGEAGGALSANLSYLAAELEKEAALRSRLFGSLAYPAVVTLAATFLTVSLVVFVFPKITPVFSGLHASLPASTRILLGVSGYLERHGVMTLAVLILLISGLVGAHRKSTAVRRSCERIAFALPFIGPLLVAYRVSGATRTLALLIESGMPLPSAIRASAVAAGGIAYGETLSELAAAAEKGTPLAVMLRAHRRIFPRLVADMTAAGEAGGALAESFRSLSAYYENEFDERTKRLSALVEPLLMTLMGGIVGFVAIAMIAPVYEITQHLHAT